MSACRSKADLAGVKFRKSKINVRLPLRSGPRFPTPLMSGRDPLRTFVALDAYLINRQP